MKLPAVEIADALVSYNEEVLAFPILELLAPIMPNEAEFKTVQEGIEGMPEGEEMNEEDYDACDLFIYLVGAIVGNKERVLSMLFRSTYKKDCVELLKLIDVFFKVYEFIKTNEHFKKFLTVLLAIGNYMNGTSVRGGCFGFKWEPSLPKFYDTKAKDNKTTMIQYVINTIIEDLKEPEILDIVTYLNLFPKSKNKLK
ncbi:MAG: FH2 domain-containing protein [archaeon]|nr:FH2 domain-containing protein [archaeon]